jgi:Cupin-like domain
MNSQRATTVNNGIIFFHTLPSRRTFVREQNHPSQYCFVITESDKVQPGMMSRTIAAVLLGVCGVFLVSCCVLQIQINHLEANNFASLSLSGREGVERKRLSRRRHQKETRTNPNSQRRQYESSLDPSVIASTVERTRIDDFPFAAEAVPYDIRRCPDEIPEQYPIQWNVLDVLSNWNPDNTTIPSKIYQGVCALDWNDDHQRRLAEKYREAELPFLLHNHPEIWRTAERWSHYDYLTKLLGDSTTYRNEHSWDNHMPYWKLRGDAKKPHGWKPPTDNVELSFPDWYSKAIHLEEKISITEAEHYYFRLNGEYQHDNNFLYDELPIFIPDDPSFFMPDPEGQRGINCRFGSKGIIAETHYDYSRNFILILKGRKRYVLAHPRQCPNLELYGRRHPSARHSKVDWSNPLHWHTGRFPLAQVNEVILQAGDALYLPTAWFHFIVSLTLNYQCNARSGISEHYSDDISKCGFPTTRTTR